MTTLDNIAAAQAHLPKKPFNIYRIRRIFHTVSLGILASFILILSTFLIYGHIFGNYHILISSDFTAGIALQTVVGFMLIASMIGLKLARRKMSAQTVEFTAYTLFFFFS